MVSILQALYDFLAQLVCWIMTALIMTLNLLLAALGALISLLAALLPDQPDIPEVPASMVTAASWINWIFPVGTVASFFTFIVGAWLVWQGVVIALRWAKATSQ